MEISLGKKRFNVKEARTDEERREGLQNKKSLNADEGMIFFFDYPGEYQFWMKDTSIPLDIIFVNDEEKVTKVYKANPNDERLVSSPETLYVVEVSQNSGVRKGDVLDLDPDDDGPIMKVLDENGQPQMELWGGERIVSRKETKVLIRKAKKADKEQTDSSYKSLGKYFFSVLHKQDNRPGEFIDSPN